MLGGPARGRGGPRAARARGAARGAARIRQAVPHGARGGPGGLPASGRAGGGIPPTSPLVPVGGRGGGGRPGRVLQRGVRRLAVRGRDRPRGAGDGDPPRARARAGSGVAGRAGLGESRGGTAAGTGDARGRVARGGAGARGRGPPGVARRREVTLRDQPGPVAGRKTYELWAITGGTPRPAGLFGVDAKGAGGLRIEPAPEGRPVDVFAITIEPAGGVPAPTGPIVLASSK